MSMLFQISWYKDGNVKLSTSDEIVITENDQKYSLKIEKLRERNFGLFSCRASSHLGTSEAALEISGNVNGSYRFHLDFKNAPTYLYIVVKLPSASCQSVEIFSEMNYLIIFS